MAVFTEITEERATALLSSFSIGALKSLRPIASGIENTNYFLDTDQGRWVLTVFERLSAKELPFYLELCDHLAARGCRVARPQRTRSGSLLAEVCGKPCSIANRLAGEEVADMGLPECRSMGELLAQMHLAARDFPIFQENLRGLSWWQMAAEKVKPYVPASISGLYEAEIAHQAAVMASPEYRSLTVSACHCDLFRNNTLIADAGTPGAHVAGVFDFYFAGCVPWLYDLAVTMNDWCIDPASGRFIPEKAAAFINAYDAVRPLTGAEKSLWRDMLRAGALRFWMSRLYDFYLPRKAALLTPHDPTHFERVLKDRLTCELPWPDNH